jgi:small subunit ribosomal protein S20
MPRVPNIKAAEKWVRHSEKRTLRNRDVKTRLKTLYKKAVGAGDAAASPSVESQFDKAAQKGIIHPNKAARKKSRLAKALNVKTPQEAPKPAKAVKAAKAAPQAEVVAKPAPKRSLLSRIKKSG